MNRKLIFSGLTMVFFLMLVVAACGRGGGTQDIQSQKTELRNTVQQTLDSLDVRISTFTTQINMQGVAATPEMRQQLQNLNDERTKLSSRLGEIGPTTADNWNTFRTQVNDEIDKAKVDMRG